MQLTDKSKMSAATSASVSSTDTALDVLVLQRSPNDGVRLTRGRLGVNYSPTAAFDIMPTPDGGNRAFAVSRRVLNHIDLDAGRARRTGTIANLDLELVDITIVPAPR